MALAVRSVKTLIPGSIFSGDCRHARLHSFSVPSPPYFRTRSKASATKMASTIAQGRPKTIDSHLHVWASPQEAADKYPYFPGQEPTLPGHLDFLLQCMEEGSVDGALIVQPINHKFDHSLVTSVLKKHPTKFVGCCLANPAEDGTGVKQLEDLILKDGYRAVRFNPYLWPSGQQVEEEDFPLWLLQTSPAPAAAAAETMLNDNPKEISGPRRRRSNGGRWVVYIVCN
ncbi:hypothetical protein V6N12_012409 [Hibiscus sabdariffa]|uniref:Amidohydrolase-related domain-containing protein n=1 Tax=Hibiscus sabdariffa TaxID=183260 RepID=A0ABR2CHZ5_9ROSI